MLDNAKLYCHGAVIGYQIVLGPDDHRTLSSKANLAMVLQDQGNLKEAETLCREVLSGVDNYLQEEPTLYTNTIKHLQLILEAQGRPDEATALGALYLEKTEQILGPHHRATVEGYFEKGARNISDPEASDWLFKSWNGFGEMYGSNHLETLKSVFHLGLALSAQNKFSEAEPLLRHALRSLHDSESDSYEAYLIILNTYVETGRKSGMTDRLTPLINVLHEYQLDTIVDITLEEYWSRRRRDTKVFSENHGSSSEYFQR